MAVQNSNSFTIVVGKTGENKLSFAHTQDASISFSNSLVEATLGVSNGWAEFLPGKKTASISFSGLQDFGTVVNRHSTDDLADYLLDADLLEFQIGTTSNYETGMGYVSEITLEGSADDVATYSGVLTIVGELSADLDGEIEKLQDSDGNDILDDAGDPIYVKIR